MHTRYDGLRTAGMLSLISDMTCEGCFLGAVQSSFGELAWPECNMPVGLFTDVLQPSPYAPLHDREVLYAVRAR